MDFAALYHASFKLLDDAVTDWSTLVRHLEDLKKDAEGNLHKAANTADRAGVNARVQEFTDKTADEFADAHTQATTVHNILGDVRDELKGFHQQLKDAVARDDKKGLSVIDTGSGSFTVASAPRPDWYPDPSGAKGGTRQKDVDDTRNEIQGILTKAGESDTSARTVLTAVADHSALGFSDAGYKDLDTEIPD
jgi:hypothetical protein